MPNLSNSSDKKGVRITCLSGKPESVRVHDGLTGAEIPNVQKIEFDTIEPGQPLIAKITCVVDSLDMFVESDVEEVGAE